MDSDIQRSLEENGKPPQGGAPVKLSFEHILGAMFLLFFGNTIAIISFLVEVFLDYYYKKRQESAMQLFQNKRENII